MSIYEILLSILIATLATYLVLLIAKRNAKRAIAQREKELMAKMRMYATQHRSKTPIAITQIHLDEERKRIKKKYVPQMPEPEKRRYDDDVIVPPDYYPTEPYHHTHSHDHSDHGGGGSFDGGGSSDSFDSGSSDSGSSHSSGDGGGGD